MMDEPDHVTIEWIGEQVAAIRECVGDPDSAHSMEDDLYRIVLEHIGAGKVDDPALCACAALETKELDFPRWCA